MLCHTCTLRAQSTQMWGTYGFDILGIAIVVLGIYSIFEIPERLGVGSHHIFVLHPLLWDLDPVRLEGCGTVNKGGMVQAYTCRAFICSHGEPCVRSRAQSVPLANHA